LVWGFSTGLRSPYRGWLRWHHSVGLLFGAVSFTWIFSGLLSMDPWDWHPGTSPTKAQRASFSGGPLRLDAITVDGLRRAIANARSAKEIEILPFNGNPRWIVDGHAHDALDRDVLVAVAREALPGASVADVASLDRYDAYYYDRAGELPLPILRVRFDD